MTNEQIAFIKRRIRKYQKKGYAWLISWAKATEDGIRRFIVWPTISTMKMRYIKRLADDLKTIIDDQEHRQDSGPENRQGE